MKEYDISDWELQIGLHWPHNRLALGYDVIYPSEKFNYTTINLYLLLITITIDF